MTQNPIPLSQGYEWQRLGRCLTVFSAPNPGRYKCHALLGNPLLHSLFLLIVVVTLVGSLLYFSQSLSAADNCPCSPSPFLHPHHHTTIAIITIITILIVIIFAVLKLWQLLKTSVAGLGLGDDVAALAGTTATCVAILGRSATSR